MKRVFLSLLACSLLVGMATVADAAKKAPEPAKQSGPEQSVVKKDLDVAGKSLVGRASRTVMPSKAKPKYTKSGKEHIVTYVLIDSNDIRTEVRKGSTSATPYVGIVEYREDTMECRGASKKEAMEGRNCKKLSSSTRKEMIRHDGKKWNY